MVFFKMENSREFVFTTEHAIFRAFWGITAELRMPYRYYGANRGCFTIVHLYRR
jgi:hypothetical protein